MSLIAILLYATSAVFASEKAAPKTASAEQYWILQLEPPVLMLVELASSNREFLYSKPLITVRLDFKGSRVTGEAIYKYPSNYDKSSFGGRGEISGWSKGDQVQLRWSVPQQFGRSGAIELSGVKDAKTGRFVGKTRLSNVQRATLLTARGPSGPIEAPYEPGPADPEGSFSLSPLSRVSDALAAKQVKIEIEDNAKKRAYELFGKASSRDSSPQYSPDLADAERFYNAAIADARQYKGHEWANKILVLAHNNLACTYFRMRRFNDAQAEFRATLSLAKELAASKQHQDTIVENITRASQPEKLHWPKKLAY